MKVEEFETYGFEADELRTTALVDRLNDLLEAFERHQTEFHDWCRTKSTSELGVEDYRDENLAAQRRFNHLLCEFGGLAKQAVDDSCRKLEVMRGHEKCEVMSEWRNETLAKALEEVGIDPNEVPCCTPSPELQERLRETVFKTKFR